MCGCLKKRMKTEVTRGLYMAPNKHKTIMRCYSPSTSTASFQDYRNGEDEGRGMSWKAGKDHVYAINTFPTEFKHVVHLLYRAVRSERFFLYFSLRRKESSLTYGLLAKAPRATFGA